MEIQNKLEKYSLYVIGLYLLIGGSVAYIETGDRSYLILPGIIVGLVVIEIFYKLTKKGQ